MQSQLIYAKDKKREPVQLTLFENHNDAQITLYRFARVVYASGGGKSLCCAHALASMTVNLCKKTGRSLSDIITDENIFDVLCRNHINHDDLLVDSSMSSF
ncbi:MAG: hypothetical protein FWC83_00580, partial [Alphaproteobacteria bacterium]|nr:hypothetical protein [Alphaproteobacteria bacterium]